MNPVATIAMLALLLATGAAHAKAKERVNAHSIELGLMPPPRYDKPFDGELSIVLFSSGDDIKRVCKGEARTGCTHRLPDGKKCTLYVLSEEIAKREGKNFAFVLRHETAHCNGWNHPFKTERTWQIGETWKEAEGAKWLRANAKMEMPTLPPSTRMLPASPPVVCVTPEWKPEPCKNREVLVVSEPRGAVPFYKLLPVKPVPQP
jgi:hypothetical protein